MSLDTYANLKTELADWIVHVPGSGKIDTAIDLLEAEMQRVFRGYESEGWKKHTNSSGDVQNCIPLPSDWNGARKIMRDCKPMEHRTVAALDKLRVKDNCGTLGSEFGGYYAIENQRICLYPSLADGSDLELTYWQKFTPLDGTTTTNWVLTNWPDIYLYGSLLHLGNFVKSSFDREQARAMVDRFLSQYEQDKNEKLHAGSPLTMKML